MHTSEDIVLHLTGVDRTAIAASGAHFILRSETPKLLLVEKIILASDFNEAGEWSGNVTLEGVFLGITSVYIELEAGDGQTTIERSPITLPVVIIRELRMIDSIFTGSVAALVSILYINFGAALNLKSLRGIVTRPIGPAIGFVGQFLFMPLVSTMIFETSYGLCTQLRA